jgi:hypothetical protein
MAKLLTNAVSLTIDPRAARGHVEPSTKILTEKVEALGGFEAVREHIRNGALGGVEAIRERIRNGEQPEPLGLTGTEIMNLAEAEFAAQLIHGSEKTQVEHCVMRGAPSPQSIDEQRFELVKAGVEPSVAMEFLELTKTYESKPKRVN